MSDGVEQQTTNTDPTVADSDNDGLVDAFISNGMSRNFNEKDDPDVLRRQPGKTEWDRHEHKPPMPEQNLAFRNRGDLRFEDVSKAWGLDHVGMSYATASGDLDRPARRSTCATWST